MKVKALWKMSDEQLAPAMKKINESKEPEDGVPRFIYWITKYICATEGEEKSRAAWEMATVMLMGKQGKLYADILTDIDRLKSTILGLPYEINVPNDVEDGIRAALKSCKRIVCNDRDMQPAVKEWLSIKYNQPCEAIEILKD